MAIPHIDPHFDAHLDGIVNVLSGLGFSGNDNARASVMTFDRAIEPEECWAYYLCDPIARGEIDRIWDDGIRAPFDLTGENVDYDWRSVESQLADLRVVAKGGLAGKYGDLLGAAFVIPEFDDGLKSDKPLNVDAIKSIKQLHVVTGERLKPVGFNFELGSDVTAQPVMYELTGSMGNDSNVGTRIHHTRLWRFSSEELPPQVYPMIGGYPPSKLTRLKTALDAYNTANNYTLNAMNTVSVMCMQVEGLREMVCKPEGEAKVRQLFKALRWSIDNLRLLPIDKEKEAYVEVKRSVEGFAKMAEVAKGWVLAASERPNLILWGEQPAGLNADSRGEVRSWYDQCEVHRRDRFEPYLNWVLDLIFAARRNNGEDAPATWTIKWEPLMSPAPDQIASQAQQWAAALAPLVAAGVITPEEAHTTLVDRGIISVPIVGTVAPDLQSRGRA